MSPIGASQRLKDEAITLPCKSLSNLKKSNFNENLCYRHCNIGLKKFQKHAFSFTFHEVNSNVSIDCSPCLWDCQDAESWKSGLHTTLAMAVIQPGGLHNLGKTAGEHLPHANPWRRPPRWPTRAGVVQIWQDHQCCSYSVANSSALLHWRQLNV